MPAAWASWAGPASSGQFASPGILTATALDPAGGLACAFEFTQANPSYSSASASGNDVLRLSDLATPFVASLTSANSVDVYLSQTALATGTLTGGFFTDRQADFLADVSAGIYRYFVQSPGGSYSYNGQTYQTLAQYEPGKTVTVSTVAAGSGQVTQFVITVPEPTTAVSLAVALAVAGLMRLRGRDRLEP